MSISAAAQTPAKLLKSTSATFIVLRTARGSVSLAKKDDAMGRDANKPEDGDDAMIDGQEFRTLMRSMVAGVTVITTSHDGGAHGMTATAFSSVSAEPPTILIVLNRSARTHPLVSASKHFVVNLLAEDQIALGQRFAGKLDNQFDGVRYIENEFGVPVIDGSAASLECETVSEMNVGTHTIFIGRVVKGAMSAMSPLVYHNGSYKTVVEPCGKLAIC
jgi:flavin reductase